MAMMPAGYRRGRYGCDAPLVPIMMIGGGVVCLAIAIIWAAGPVPIAYGPLWPGLYGLALLLGATSFVYTTRRGKFAVWAREIARLELNGDERMLDAGCGSGVVLLEVAQYLPQGEAVGIDLWRTRDQSGNRRARTLANAQCEGVADRVTLHTGDIVELPFPDDDFDLVVSSLVLHNIRRDDRRQRSLAEAVRVLRPGGRLLLADLRHINAYCEQLAALGMRDVQRHSAGWQFWYGGPPWATCMVSAVKPDVAE